MTGDNLRRIAWDAGCAITLPCGNTSIPQSILNAMSLAVAGEREACAKIAEQTHAGIALKIRQRVNDPRNV